MKEGVFSKEKGREEGLVRRKGGTRTASEVISWVALAGEHGLDVAGNGLGGGGNRLCYVNHSEEAVCLDAKKR